MIHSLKLARPALYAGLILLSSACSSTGDNYGKARFVLTPDGAGATKTVTVEAKYHNPVTGDCHLELYVMRENDRYIQFSPFGIGSNCEGTFEARIDLDGEQCDLNGNVQRAFGGNTSTPFATGIYYTGSGATGTFAFYEDELPDL